MNDDRNQKECYMRRCVSVKCIMHKIYVNVNIRELPPRRDHLIFLQVIPVNGANLNLGVESAIVTSSLATS